MCNTGKIAKLEYLVECLRKSNRIEEKIQILNKETTVESFLAKNSFWKELLAELTPEEEFIVKSIFAIGQGEILFQNPYNLRTFRRCFNDLLSQLQEVESFYDTLGGIIGYHLTVLKVIQEGEKLCCEESQGIRYLKPQGINLDSETDEVRKAIIDGIHCIKGLVEIYPVGGAGDRLMLKDDKTEALLPAACLEFCGRTLLETLVRDLQAREYLYFKLFSQQIVVPIAMMTSHEKNNHELILKICEQYEWFGRTRSSFFIFIQPLVPVISKEGDWSCYSPMKLTMKPGGHGVIWKLAIDKGIFDAFEKNNCTHALVRQLNNPIAGIDYGNLALIGIGCKEKKSFGFASCPRHVGTSEGMNVLMEKKVDGEYQYSITNIEYTDFVKKGIEDVVGNHPPYSIFPANTNILFANLKAVREAVKHAPMPGMLMNMKHNAYFLTSNGHVSEKQAGRLETTMQNLLFIDRYNSPISETQELQTFITYNVRHKTISVTKRSYEPGKGLAETPEGCFYDLLINHHDLLVNTCNMQLPALNSPEEYLEKGPNFVIQLHPALGPLYSIIAQKIRGGKMTIHSELNLEITEVDIQNIDLNGSLHIYADSPMGIKNHDGIVKYGHFCGKCELEDVKVENLGIDQEAQSIYWKNQIYRKENCEIILHGFAEFYAKNVTFKGNHRIVVPDGHRMVAYEEEGKLLFQLKKIEGPTWCWNYRISEDNRIVLNKESYS